MTVNLRKTPRPIVIDRDEAVRLIELAVADKSPDYVYRDEYADCVYSTENLYSGGVPLVPTPAPACIVGHALIHAGFPLADLSSLAGSVLNISGWEPDNWDGYWPQPESAATVDLIDLTESDLSAHGIELTEDAVRIWQVAQAVQDNNDGTHTWGEALDAATEVARLLTVAQS